MGSSPVPSLGPARRRLEESIARRVRNGRPCMVTLIEQLPRRALPDPWTGRRGCRWDAACTTERPSASERDALYTTMTNERRLADGRVELVDTRRVEASPLYNHDLAPVPLSRRNWTTYNYAALWVSMAHCIPTYMLASGPDGVGHELVAGALHDPARQHDRPDPDPAQLAPGHEVRHSVSRCSRARPTARSGRTCPALMRALVACGWFGIQAWIGGEALQHVLHRRSFPAGRRCSAPAFGGHTTTEWLSFLLFWGLNIFIIYRGMDLLREVENWAAPFVLVMTGAAALVGGVAGQRPRAAARAARKVPHARRVLAGLRAVADRDDRLLGDALAQHAGLHALRPQPARADRSARSSRCRRRCRCLRRWA